MIKLCNETYCKEYFELFNIHYVFSYIRLGLIEKQAINFYKL